MKTFNSILELAKRFDTDLKCRKYLAEVIWDNKPICPHCGNDEAYHFKDGRRYKCKTCKKQFTVTVGTIFEGSHIPLQKWIIGMYLLGCHSKGISSVQLAKDLHITQRSAWYMAHRLRYSVRSQSFIAPLDNTVELDETFVGGKDKFKHKNKRGLTPKTVVFGMVERESGEVRTQVVRNTWTETLAPIVVKNVSTSATLMTDGAHYYYQLKKFYLLHSVNHLTGEYVRDNVHTNSIENFWSLFKRGVVGIYHQISPKHTDKYLDEFEFRYNLKKHKDGQVRINALLKKSSGYLSYKELIAKK